MTKLAPERVRYSDPVIRSPARYRWTTVPALNQREQDRDARAVVVAVERAQQELIRSQSARIEKTNGEDKVKLHRWIKDLDLIEGVQLDTVIETAIRTAQGHLSDTIEAFLADPANAPRAGVAWPALKANIETLLLGDAYAEVLRCEHRTIHQKAHEDTTVYSEWYLISAKAAYVEPWDAVTNQMLTSHFA